MQKNIKLPEAGAAVKRVSRLLVGWFDRDGGDHTSSPEQRPDHFKIVNERGEVVEVYAPRQPSNPRFTIYP